MADGAKRSPLIAAGIVMGAGLGGFADGIALHQIFQWHNMLSGWVPPNTLVDAKVNMTWDGIFHAGVWVLTAVGLGMLWRAGARRDVAWSGKTFLGALVLGWGLFNLIEGVIDHHLLGVHHVYEYTPNKLPWDLGFLIIGGVLTPAVGWLIMRAGSGDTAVRGAAADRT
jgi:uncharacterized membrane protein